MAADFQAMMRDNGINHRASSAYNPHSNNRAETGVKSMKRLLDEHAVRNDLQNEDFIQAMITHRNTPIGRGLPSPNELVFGRKVPDYLPRPNKARMEKTAADDKKEWRRKLEQMEIQRDLQDEKDAQRWSEHTRQLAALENGTSVAIQNSHGNEPTRWDKRGQIVRYNGFDSYDVMVENSRRITTRNRRHLRKIKKTVDMTIRRPEEPTPKKRPASSREHRQHRRRSQCCRQRRRRRRKRRNRTSRASRRRRRESVVLAENNRRPEIAQEQPPARRRPGWTSRTRRTSRRGR